MNNVKYKICAESVQFFFWFFCHAVEFKSSSMETENWLFFGPADRNNWPTCNLLCLLSAFVVTSVWIYLKIFWQYLQVNKKRILNVLSPPEKLGWCYRALLFVYSFLNWDELYGHGNCGQMGWRGSGLVTPWYVGSHAVANRNKDSRDISVAGCADVHNTGKRLQTPKIKQDHKGTKEHNNGHDDQTTSKWLNTEGIFAWFSQDFRPWQEKKGYRNLKVLLLLELLLDEQTSQNRTYWEEGTRKGSRVVLAIQFQKIIPIHFQESQWKL